MTDLSAFFDPIEPATANVRSQLAPGFWGKQVEVYEELFPVWEECDLICFGVETHDENSGSFDAAEEMRQALYRLTDLGGRIRVVDVGNLKSRESLAGTREALAYALGLIFRAGKQVLILGGNPSLALGIYQAYEGVREQVEYVHIDSALRMNDIEGFNDDTYNLYVLGEKDPRLFQFAHLGYQRYLVPAAQLQQIREHHHVALRYGNLSDRIEEAEPLLRNADMVSFDLSAIRRSEAPGGSRSMPGGFSVVEACRLARYAGIGYQVSALHLTGYDPGMDVGSGTADVAAMLAWYFVEGKQNQWDDFPQPDRRNLRRYSVQLHASIDHIDFFQHPGTDRWWMEVIHPDHLPDRSPEHTLLIPCTRHDYEFAKTDDIPDRWWLIYARLGERGQ